MAPLRRVLEVGLQVVSPLIAYLELVLQLAKRVVRVAASLELCAAVKACAARRWKHILCAREARELCCEVSRHRSRARRARARVVAGLLLEGCHAGAAGKADAARARRGRLKAYTAILCPVCRPRAVSKYDTAGSSGGRLTGAGPAQLISKMGAQQRKTVASARVRRASRGR